MCDLILRAARAEKVIENVLPVSVVAGLLPRTYADTGFPLICIGVVSEGNGWTDGCQWARIWLPKVSAIDLEVTDPGLFTVIIPFTPFS